MKKTKQKQQKTPQTLPNKLKQDTDSPYASSAQDTLKCLWVWIAMGLLYSPTNFPRLQDI